MMSFIKTKREVGMATRRQKRRQARRTRKQKGGVQVFMKKQSKTAPATIVDVNSNSTPRQLLQKFFDQNNTISSNMKSVIKQNDPKIGIETLGKKYLLTKTQWDTAKFIPIEKDREYIFTPRFGFKTNSQEERRVEEGKKTFQYLVNAMNLLKGGTIVLESGAITPDPEKNVKQQFMFEKPFPKILVDVSFFKDKEDFDFYRYLDFEETISDTLGPEDKIRLYRKPAGTPLEILPEEKHRPNEIYPSEKEKFAYLKLVKKEAQGFDLQNNDITIICVNHDISMKEKGYSIQDYIAKHDLDFEVITWSGVKSKNKV